MTVITGKIYAIVSPSIFKCYIGSTKNNIKQRLWKHENSVGCTSRTIINQHDYKMIILEIFSCETIKDLRRREGEWINSMLGSGMIVNKNSSGKTKEETMKDRYIKNKEYIKKYHNDNKTHILKLAHDYYLKNKEDIHIRKNQKFICECGGKYTNANKNAHQQTIKHISQT